MSDLLYRAPSDKITKLLINQKVPVYMYVLNTTIEAFRWPEWRKVPHDTELLFLTGAPFMDTGMNSLAVLFEHIFIFCFVRVLSKRLETAENYVD